MLEMPADDEFFLYVETILEKQPGLLLQHRIGLQGPTAAGLPEGAAAVSKTTQVQN